MIVLLKRLTDCRDEIETHRKRLSKLPEADRFDGDLKRHLQRDSTKWYEVFAEHGFQRAFRTVERLNNQLAHKASNVDVMRRLADLGDDYESDAGEIWLHTIPESLLGYYDTVFNGTVATDFPEATVEIKEAGTCLAFGRFSACVFHLMRGVEHGMRAVALGVDPAANSQPIPLEYQVWQTIIGDIERKTKHAADSWPEPARANARAFFKGTVSDLYAFKDETRNVCMHTRHGLHTLPAAVDVRSRVKRFFQRLEGKVSEHVVTSLLDPALFT